MNQNNNNQIQPRKRSKEYKDSDDSEKKDSQEYLIKKGANGEITYKYIYNGKELEIY